MLRLKLLLVGLGGMLAFFGCQEFRVSQGTTPEPLNVELANLEQEPTVHNTHLNIGEHLALYPYAVYEYELETGESEPTLASSVNYAYYPIISYEHPYLFELSQVLETYGGDVDAVPDEVWPSLQDFTVLVKTKSFKTVGSIPEDWGEETAIQGLVINRIQGLDAEEKGLIQESFPGLDPDRLILLEAGRKPSSPAKSLGMMTGGTVLGFAGVAFLVLPRLR